MDSMEAMLKILKILEKSLDDKELNFKLVEYENIGVSRYKWNKLIGLLQNEGLIDGFKEFHHPKGSIFFEIINPTITFRGILYIAENTKTAKIINAAKLLKDIIPGV